MVESQELGDLHLTRKMDLQSFNMIIAFSGWPDARRVATYAAAYLRDKLNADKIGKIDSAPFYDFAIQRPFINIEKGMIKEYQLPQNELYAWKSKKDLRNILILMGEEPHTNWPRYVESIFQALHLGTVHRICLLGGLIDQIPHTVDPLVSGVATTLELMEEMKLHGVEPIDYTGPSGIHSLVMSECGRRGFPALSLWGHVPAYISGVDARTAHQLLSKLNAIVGVEVDLEDLRHEGNLLQKQLDAAMARDRSFSESVRQLEFEYKNSRKRPDYIT
jgi:proteasome assembly chaperone (PAC2) family protein